MGKSDYELLTLLMFLESTFELLQSLQTNTINIFSINGKTNCSLFTKHFVPNSDLLTQNKMCTLPSLNKI